MGIQPWPSRRAPGTNPRDMMPPEMEQEVFKDEGREKPKEHKPYIPIQEVPDPSLDEAGLIDYIDNKREVEKSLENLLSQQPDEDRKRVVAKLKTFKDQDSQNRLEFVESLISEFASAQKPQEVEKSLDLPSKVDLAATQMSPAMGFKDSRGIWARQDNKNRPSRGSEQKPKDRLRRKAASA